MTAHKIPISTVYAVAGNLLAQNENLGSNSEMMLGPWKDPYRAQRLDEIAQIAIELAEKVEYRFEEKYGPPVS